VYHLAAKARLAPDGPEIRSLTLIMDALHAHLDRMVALARPAIWHIPGRGQNGR